MACVFCDFVSGKRKRHKNGFPFKMLHETKGACAFLSVDFPAADNGHMIVIPKKHFGSLEGIPSLVLAEVVKEVKFVSGVLRKANEGTNILLNNGMCAGQVVPHAHFHVIPRNSGDGIHLEHFKRRELSLGQFERLHRKLRKCLLQL